MEESQFPLCMACGTQYDVPDLKTPPERCRICDDPRQFIPETGQQWTTSAELRRDHKNKIDQDAEEAGVWHIDTEPKFAIGQRAIFLETEHGNVLWDLIANLDAGTVNFINSKGGLKAIVISHPHFYTTYVEWARIFKCPVYVSPEDQGWLCRQPPSKDMVKFIHGSTEIILPGVLAIKTGGHFDGSLCLKWRKILCTSDSIMTVASGLSPHPRPPAHITYSFMYAIPNMIPLGPDAIQAIWDALKPFEFNTTFGNLKGRNVRGEDLKPRVLQSMKVQLRAMGWDRHPLLQEEV